jgi:hypothetical protein
VRDDKRRRPRGRAASISSSIVVAIRIESGDGSSKSSCGFDAMARAMPTRGDAGRPTAPTASFGKVGQPT